MSVRAGESMRRSQNLEICEKNFIRHFARFNFSRLSLAFIMKYCGEKIIRLASKNSVKLDEKLAGDFMSL